MFKKPPSDLKTSAPLRGSDRRKLKQRVMSEFGISSEEADALVPEGLLLQKFKTHIEELGVLYWSPDGDPFWFTIGKGSEALIPTGEASLPALESGDDLTVSSRLAHAVYTLWKQPTLLPFLTTPAAVIPKLVGGADLMIPGGVQLATAVIQHSSILEEGQLVSISQYHRGAALGYPIAVGRMAVANEMLTKAVEDDSKGKAAYVLHTWKDSLWDLGHGRKAEVPEPRPFSDEPEKKSIPTFDEGPQAIGEDDDSDSVNIAGNNTAPAQTTEAECPAAENAHDSSTLHNAPRLSPEDASSCLRSALLQAISTTLSALPLSSFPMTASTFWTTCILPARPVSIMTSGGLVDASGVDVKSSTHKTVKTFLKACAKEGLLKLKETKGDVVVTGVSPSHPAVTSHQPHRTIQSIQVRQERAEERERQQREEEEKRRAAMHVKELWKPFNQTIAWFVAAEKDTTELYTVAEIKDVFNAYVSSKRLINPHEQEYINIAQDDALARAVSKKNEEIPEFLKREEALRQIRENMQRWYELSTDGRVPVRKKGEIKPIDIDCKMRQGRKAVTLIIGFEFFSLEAEELADELRKVCQSSTSVSNLPGKASDMEVMVQGDQRKKVADLLIAKGVPKEWVKVGGIATNKKKR